VRSKNFSFCELLHTRLWLVWLLDISSFVEVPMMIAVTQALSRITGKDVNTDSLSAILIFCGIGLLSSLVAIIYGLDLSVAFF